MCARLCTAPSFPQWANLNVPVQVLKENVDADNQINSYRQGYSLHPQIHGHFYLPVTAAEGIAAKHNRNQEENHQWQPSSDEHCHTMRYVRGKACIFLIFK